jgi:hypothetical protein
MSLPLAKDERHKLQVRHNEELIHEAIFSNAISQTSLKYNDWLVTIAFYISLHHIQTFLFQNNYQSSFNSHTERNEYLKYLTQIDRRVNKIADKYISLYKLSRLCRYTPGYFSYLRSSDIKAYVNFATLALPKELGLS